MSERVPSSVKILSLAGAAQIVRAEQRAGRTVVLCHGCFDIVHPGHIRHLQQARRQGDRLLVTITADVELHKGTGRPLIPQELRCENLAELTCVDWVAVNGHPTAAELLETIRPDIYVKGAEYEHNRDARFAAERAAVERYGGRVVFTSGDVIFSSTALIAAMEETANPFHARLRQLIAQHGIRPGTIDPILSAARGLRVVVTGETIIDTYVMCDRPEVAGESPVMTLRPVGSRSFDGGAAIVARHVAAMGGRPTLVTALPRTPQGRAVRSRLEEAGVEVRALEVNRPLIEKQRFLVGTQKVMKLDLGEPLVLDAAQREGLVGTAAAAAEEGEASAAIIADFGQGLFTGAVLGALCGALRARVPVMSGDVSGRRSNLLAMRGMDLLCPSESEARDALHSYDEGLTAVIWRLLGTTESKGAIVTLGDEGLITFSRTADASKDPDDWRSRLTAEHVPALSPFAVDQLGCGDALLAAATLALAAGSTPVVAAVLGSVAAAAEVQRLGNAVVGATELRLGMARLCEAQLAFAGGASGGVIPGGRERRAAERREAAGSAAVPGWSTGGAGGTGGHATVGERGGRTCVAVGDWEG